LARVDDFANDAELVLVPPSRVLDDTLDERAAMGTTTRSRENDSTFD